MTIFALWFVVHQVEFGSNAVFTQMPPKCQVCKTNDCYFDNKTKQYSPYCRNSCKLAAKAMVTTKPKAHSPVPIITTVTTTKYQDISAQFLSKWTTMATVKPTIIAILKIQVSTPVQSKFEQYQQTLKHIKPYKKGDTSNTQRRSHRTTQLCTLGSFLITS